MLKPLEFIYQDFIKAHENLDAKFAEFSNTLQSVINYNKEHGGFFLLYFYNIYGMGLIKGMEILMNKMDKLKNKLEERCPEACKFKK